MLIEFSVENFLSIRDRVTLSMVAGSSKEMRDSHLWETDAPASPPCLLRSAAIYGPNAAGKSNLVSALGFMQMCVRVSANESPGDERIPVEPFRLDADSASKPSVFEVAFVEGGVRYEYGFAVDAERFHEEWLVAWPKGQPQRWFERSYDPKADEETWTFSALFPGRKQVIRESTRPNALFLSTAAMLNHEAIQPVFHWLTKRLRVITARHTHYSLFTEFTADRCGKESDFCSKVLSFLQASDLGIDGLEIESEELEIPEVLAKEVLPPSVRRRIKEGKFTHQKPLFVHKRTDDEAKVVFELEDESDGTAAVFSLAGPWLDVLEHGYVLVVDELDTSLHPHLLRFLVNCFHGPRNGSGAQLVFTTHDVTLMDNVFRRDQLWFVDKGRNRATRLYPLLEFHARTDEAIRKRYLDGRYGAVPVLD
jgi:uncharacterized protein